MTGGYDRLHARSLKDPEGFWAEAAAAIDWDRSWDKVLDAANPPFYRWFRGARCNTCWNAVDRHIGRGRGEIGPQDRCDSLARILQRLPRAAAGAVLAGRIGIARGVALGHRRGHFGQQRAGGVVVEVDGVHGGVGIAHRHGLNAEIGWAVPTLRIALYAARLPNGTAVGELAQRVEQLPCVCFRRL